MIEPINTFQDLSGADAILQHYRIELELILLSSKHTQLHARDEKSGPAPDPGTKFLFLTGTGTKIFFD